MKIAMPYQDGVLLEHFGRAKEFIIYNVSDLDPVTSEVIAPEDLSHAAVARALKEHGVDVVLCGSIGEHASFLASPARRTMCSSAFCRETWRLSMAILPRGAAAEAVAAAVPPAGAPVAPAAAAEPSASPTSKRAPLPTL